MEGSRAVAGGAVDLWSRGRLDEALSAALTGVALADSLNWPVGASVARLVTGREAASKHYIALRLACEPCGASSAAEFIEPARTPALPGSSDAAWFTSFTPVDDSAAAILSRPVGYLHPIEVSGVSWLPAH